MLSETQDVITSFDVCVIGAGPAGSTIAKLLCELGYKVVLVEKEKFPRHNIGLTLTPNINHFLQLLNIKDEISKAGFIKAKSPIICWTNDEAEKSSTNKQQGFHVDRGIFDQILLDSAKSSGVHIRQPYHSKKPRWIARSNGNGYWKIPLTGLDKQIITADFLVEATGDHSLLHTRKTRYLPKTIATYAYWYIPELKQKQAIIEAGSEHWCWGVQTSGDTYLACVFSDPKALKSNAQNVEEFYKQKLKQSDYLEFCLKGMRHSEIQVCSATCFYDNSPISERHIKVGNASFSIDPLSSQGVQKAIMSAYQGSIVVNTILSSEHETKNAIAFYKLIQKISLNQHKKWVQDYYFQHKKYKNNPFWKARSVQLTDASMEESFQGIYSPDQKLTICTNIKFKFVPIINGSYIEKKEGIIMSDSDEPIVFVGGMHVPEIVKSICGLRIYQASEYLYKEYQNKNPLKFLNWLVSRKILNLTKMGDV